MIRKLSFIPAVLAVALVTSAASCTTSPTGTSPSTSVAVPRTVAQSLVYAEVTATVANQVATGLLQAGAITADQAEQVVNTTVKVHAAVQIARGFLFNGDEASAKRQLDSVSSQLQNLSSFNATHITAAGVSP